MSDAKSKPVGYKLVTADNAQEALEKSGLRVGCLVEVKGVRVSCAGNGQYSVMPLVSAEAVTSFSWNFSTGKLDNAEDSSELEQAQA